MPNRSAEKGTRAERELINAAKDGRDPRHVSVVRSPASKGLYDVMISTHYPRRRWRRFGVNVKCNTWAPPGERTAMLALVGICEPWLARKDDRRGWRFAPVLPDGSIGNISAVPPWA